MEVFNEFLIVLKEIKGEVHMRENVDVILLKPWFFKKKENDTQYVHVHFTRPLDT